MITCSFPAFGQPLIVLLLLFPLIFVLLLLRLIIIIFCVLASHHLLIQSALGREFSAKAAKRLATWLLLGFNFVRFPLLVISSFSSLVVVVVFFASRFNSAQELFLLLGPSILVQEGHGLHLPFHPGTVGADEHVVLGVALGQPALGKEVGSPALRDVNRPNLMDEI